MDKAPPISNLPTKSLSLAAPCLVEGDAEKEEEKDPEEVANEVASHPLGFLNCFNIFLQRNRPERRPPNNKFQRFL
jgi:hypothetical protein